MRERSENHLYDRCVLWIANEDNPGETESQTKREYHRWSLSVAMLADVFGKTPEDVTNDVMRAWRALSKRG